ncbi:MAG TPA: proton-conducting transporter membrane subunit [Clostridiaceae bacterium]
MHDFLSIFFIGLIIVTTVPNIIYSIGYTEEYRKDYSLKYLWAMMALFVLSMAGVVLSDNSINFMIFWELMSVSSFFLVIFEHKKSETIKSGIMYFIMTHISGLLVMIMFILIAKFTGTYDFNALTGGAGNITGPQQLAILIMALAGFGSKAGLAPLHAWLPKAHPAATSNVSAMMSGIMLKIAIYGFIRVAFIFAKDVSVYFGAFVMLIGTITAIYAVINSLAQNDIKKLLAYSSAENMGMIFAVLGLALILRSLGLEALSALALAAAMFHILNHGIFKSLLFMSAGSVLFATSTKNMNELGGLYKKMKFASICAFIGTAAIAAVPPLNGFAGEILIYTSFIMALSQVNIPWIAMMILFCGIILALTGGGVIWASVKSFGMTYLGEPRSKKAEEVHEIPVTMKAGMAMLGAFAVLFGVFSPFIINLIYGWTSGNPAASAVGYEITIVSGVLLLIAFVVYFAVKKLIKGQPDAVGRTWACGFNDFKPYMEYSPDGFVQPGMRIFGNAAGYKKEVKIDGSIHTRAKVRDVIEANVYRRVIWTVDYLASKIIKIHYGKIQIYVSYIFITLIISLILVLKFV